MKSDTLNKLRELTKELPVLSNLVSERYKAGISYSMSTGICSGEELFYNQSLAIQRAFMNKGAIFPLHLHNQNEWIIVSNGKLIDRNENGIVTELEVGDGIRVRKGESHSIEAIEDTWLIGITIPSSEGYPHG